MWMTNTLASLAGSNCVRLDFAYDFQGRRIEKMVSAWDINESAFLAQSTNRFVYDGWNLIGIIDPESTVLQSFIWGQDLSGTLDQAGGVGGLLIEGLHNDSNASLFACYDGNGNVTAMVNSGDAKTEARYEFGPFGDLIRANGSAASANPFRFSTKYFDQETRLIYYGLRYYSPSLGRWISPDPVEEVGSLNLVAALLNNPTMRLDPYGATVFDWMRAIYQPLKLVYTMVRLLGAFTGEKIPADVFRRLEAERARIKAAIKSGTRRPSGRAGPGGPDDIVEGTSYDWKGRAVGVVAALGFVAIEAGLMAVDSAISRVVGSESLIPAIGNMYRSLERGAQAYADLDAIEAALVLTGGAGAAAVIAFGVFATAADAYVEGLDGFGTGNGG